MATDPAVQAVYKFLDLRFDESMPDWWPPLENWAEDIVAAVTPLIRWQAFNEAAEAVLADHELRLKLGTASSVTQALEVVRGLGDGEKENRQ